MTQERSNETGKTIAAGIVPELLTVDFQDLVEEVAGEHELPYRSTEDEPKILRQSRAAHDVADAKLETSQTIARRSRDAFKEACEAADADDAEASFLAVKQKLHELWNYAQVRDRPFRDLLGLLTVATKATEVRSFTQNQRDALGLAFADLPRLFLSDSLVEEHIDRFADNGIDQIMQPVAEMKGKRLKITIEEID